MGNDAAKLATIKQYLRRSNYANGAYDIANLKKIATAAFEEATEEVKITATSTEAGGMASGVVTFDKALLIQAVEELLLEVDPCNTPSPPPSGYIPDHSSRYVAT